MQNFDSRIINFVKSNFNILDFKNTYLIGIQHIAPSTSLLFETLLELGLPPNHIALLGKCYSSNPVSWHQLRQSGIFVSEDSFCFDSYEPYDDLFAGKTREFVHQILVDKGFKDAEKIILVDDGGTLLKECESLAGQKTQLVGIEQTTSGVRKIESSPLHFPVINVARSKTKLNHESKFIARMLLTQFLEYLTSNNITIHNVLVLGGGYIGRTTHRYLSRFLKVDIYDASPNKSHLTPEELLSNLPKYDAIIGCVGNHSFMAECHKYLKENVYLVSASSSDREFNAVELRRKAERYFNCHKHLHVNGIKLLNSGFPFNFNSKLRDTTELELTRSLLLAAILSATTAQKLPKRLISLESNLQKEITNIYLSSFKMKNGLYISDYEFECVNTYKNVEKGIPALTYFKTLRDSSRKQAQAQLAG